jgi:hypothetical protein
MTASLALAVAAAAPVSAKMLECNVTGNGGAGGWITDVIYIQYEDGKSEIAVADPLIQYFGHEYVVGRIDVDNAKRTTFVWAVKNTQDSGGQSANMEYRLTYLKKSSKLNMTAQALGYIGPYTARGKCKHVKAG